MHALIHRPKLKQRILKARLREAANLPGDSSIDLVSGDSKPTAKSEFGACRFDLCSNDVTSKKCEVTVKARTREAVNLPSSSIDLVSDDSKPTTKSDFGACRFDLCSNIVAPKKCEVTGIQATAKAEPGAHRLDLCSIKAKEVCGTVTAPSQAPYTLDVGLGKRIFVDLNAVDNEPGAHRLEEFVKSMGGTVLALNNFGKVDSEVAQLMRIKGLLREGRIIWLRARITEQHLENAKWISQCCRTAHRAGIPWWIRIEVAAPWLVPSLKSLKRLGYVCVLKGVDAKGNVRHDVVSDAVDINRLSTQEFEQQVRTKFESGHERDLAAVHLSKDGTTVSDEASQEAWRIKAAEDEKAIGGLRNPHLSIKKLKGDLTTVDKLGKLIDEHVTANYEVLVKSLDTLGKQGTPEVLVQAANELEKRINETFDIQPSQQESLRGELLGKLGAGLEDPDIEAVRWITERNTPLGINKPIVPCGIFPVVEPKQASDEMDTCAQCHNYASFAEHREGAEALLHREKAAGWLELFSTEAEAEAKYGKVVCSRIGVVEKWKHGEQKLRLIHDLRRSGVNQQVVMTERVILPRISDLIEDVLAVEEALEPGENWECMIADFKDAFKHLHVAEAERRFLGGRALGGTFCYRVLLFGAKAGPLLWGRVAAMIMRITSAVNRKDNCRLQCYVDDPVFVVGGTTEARNRLMLRTILLWMTMNLKLSWSKGHRGSQGEWVGAYFRPWRDGNTRGVTVGISKERAVQLGERCKKLLSMGERVPRSELRQLAGLASWMAGLMPQLNAFTRMIWAAIHVNTEFTVPVKRVQKPLQWFSALAEMTFGPLERNCRRRAGHSVLITFDGSLSGGGATLQAGIRNFSGAHLQPMLSFWAGAWTDEELKLLQIKRGDPAGQARLEAFTLLHSVSTWRKILSTSSGSLAIMGDALGVLHDAQKFRARDSVLNAVMAELALIIAPMGHDLRAIHLWTQRNETCDALSRLTEGAAMPEVLSRARQMSRPKLQYRVLQSNNDEEACQLASAS